MFGRPDKEQHRVVTAPTDRAILLHAGPGSGKTRILTSRIAYLVKEKIVAPGQITAVTFTNKAAGELKQRLDEQLEAKEEMPIVGTFHGLALRILRAYGDLVDLPESFTVCDESLQQQMVRQALYHITDFPHHERYLVTAVLEAFSACKRERHDPELCPGTHSLPPSIERYHARLPEIADHYHRLLRNHNMIDFDDLIRYAAQLLYEEQDVAEQWRADHPWLFIDEFHDIDEAQYQLVRLLVPPGEPAIMVVMDRHQRIYGWRGANQQILRHLQRDYRPRRYDLDRNYRSGGLIVEACDLLLNGGDHDRRSTIWRAEPGEVIRWWSRDERQESEWLVAEIERLQREANHSLSDIAVLYRTHRLGKRLEKRLVQGDIPLERLRRDPFLDRPEVQDIRRYLQAARNVADEVVTAALNFPRVVADDLTMIQLRQVAADRDLTMIELMRVVEDCPELGPATRYQVNAFLQLLETELAPHVHDSLPDLSERLFALLDHRRSPYLQEELPTLRGFVTFLDLSAQVAPLKEAIEQGRPLQLVAEDSLDGCCAATLVALALRQYWQLPVAVEPVDAPPRPGALRLAFGQEQPDALNILPRHAGSVRYPTTVVAWRLAAALLVACETAHHSDIVVFDLETTGLSPRYDRIVELAALRLRSLEPVDEGFQQLLDPRRSISQGAIDTHGIFPEDVRGMPTELEVLPDYLDYLGDAILMAHNAGFDLRFLHAATERAGLPQPAPHRIDTLSLARYLLPEAGSYNLETLVDELGLPNGDFHRAMADVQHTAGLFVHLWDAHRVDQQLHLLAPYLPLVATVLVAERNEQDESGMLVDAACRVLQRALHPDCWHAWIPHLPARYRDDVAARLRALADRPLPPSADDQHWRDLRARWDEYVAECIEVTESDALDDFLAYTALIHREPGAALEERVQLMTVHAAKGKEFRTVFLVGFEEGNMPYFRASSDAEKEEERRVCYVGMSRARERLYLLGCKERDDRTKQPSRFWWDLARLFD